MDNFNEIKLQLDNYYQEYKNNKNSLNVAGTKAVAKLIADMALSENGSFRSSATELARFPADVTKEFFNTVTRANAVSMQTLDEILRELQATNKEARLSQYYVLKYIFAVTLIMKYCKEQACNSDVLPQLVVFTAQFAVKSDKNKNNFYNLINNTSGGIFKLNYSNMNKDSLMNIWNALNAVYPDLSNSTYSSQISEWAEKYGFLSNETEKNDSLSPANEEKSENEISSDNDNKTAESENSAEIMAKKLYSCIRRDMAKEQNVIITAFADMISPLSKALESVQGEISKSRALGAENVTLNTKNVDLERQLNEMKLKLQNTNQSLIIAETENEELKKQVSVLENQNIYLDSKLNEAYSINSRESSLEAEKIRSDLKKAFAFLYEDWLEYESSDVTQDNYESLQAIIKKIFRSLERNGINFKEND